MMDEFLFFVGAYRSDIAKDETCLYRAVSEKQFYTQANHNVVKRITVDFMKNNEWFFKEELGDETIQNYLNRSEGELWPGYIELRALCHLFRVHFFIYYDPEAKPLVIEETENPTCTIDLAGYSANRFDLIYKKEDIASLSICQSIVYEILYKKVFELGDDVDIAVEKMLHDKNYSKQKKIHISGNSDNPDDEQLLSFDVDGEPSKVIKAALSQGIPPFPYKIAKNLDVFIYRNVEFDIWNEEKKSKMDELITPPLMPGVKCCVIGDFGAALPVGYVQEIISDEKVIVYLESGIGKKKEVEITDLIILPISKNQALSYHCKHNPYLNGNTAKNKKRYKRDSIGEADELETTPKSRFALPKCDSGYSPGGKSYQRKPFRGNSFEFKSKDYSKKQPRPRSYSASFETPGAYSHSSGYVSQENSPTSGEEIAPEADYIEQPEQPDVPNVFYVPLTIPPPPTYSDYTPERGSYNALSVPMDIPNGGIEAKPDCNGMIFPCMVYSSVPVESQGAAAVPNAMPSFYATTPPHTGASPTWVPTYASPEQTVWPSSPWMIPAQAGGSWPHPPQTSVWSLSSVPVYSSMPPIINGYSGSPPAIMNGYSGSPPTIMNGYSGSPPAIMNGYQSSPPTIMNGYPNCPPAMISECSSSPVYSTEGPVYMNYSSAPPQVPFSPYVGIPPPVPAARYFSAHYASYSEFI